MDEQDSYHTMIQANNMKAKAGLKNDFDMNEQANISRIEAEMARQMEELRLLDE